MCGLAGFLDFARSRSADEQREMCEQMARALAHRGPDDHGVWVDPSAGLALGHRRLSIVDLSPQGHQPMVSASGRYVISYNGEIYNFESLRRELSGYRYRGRSDTEVALAAFESWGVRAALPRFHGMFALALWDTTERTLWLARDRFGEKPLYYGSVGSALVFASELKAIEQLPGFGAEVDRESLAQFLRFSYVPGPRSIFRGVRKLPPATLLRVASQSDIDARPEAYFSVAALAREGREHPFEGGENAAVTELERLLMNAVKLQTVADVPLGAFLSGGIDSSTVVAMMQARASRKVRTYTIGFTEEAYDEADSARAVARHLQTDHTELYVTPAEALAVIPELPSLYDEPFADASQVPTYLVSRLARQHVTVALSGDGGDELFGGYNRYLWADSIWRRLGGVPLAGRQMLAAAIRLARPSAIDRAFALADRILPPRFRQRTPGDKLHKLADVLPATSADDLYLRLASAWKDPGPVVRVREPHHPVLNDHLPDIADFPSRMMCADAMTYLPDDILVKVDRAAMGVSLETRVPLLDPDVARFAWSLRRDLKIRDGKGKWLLREVLARHVPRTLFERPKMGFGIPIDAWLRGPLREWAESELSEARLSTYFDPAPIRKKWKEHLSGRWNWQYYVWPVLMFQGWERRYVQGP